MNLDYPHHHGQQARFSAAASRYESTAQIQRAVADRLFQGLAGIGAPRRVLDIGCGTGQLTRKLAATWPEAYVLGIDHAPGMIEEARRLVNYSARPSFVTADAWSFRPERPFDLLVSSSTLQWLQPIDSAMKVLAGFLDPAGGAFAFALMLDGTLRELHEARQAVAPLIAPSRRMPTDAEAMDALRGAGLIADLTEIEERATHAPTAQALLHTLHHTGVTGGSLSRGARLLNRSEIKALLARYDECYRDEHGVFATYRVGYYWGTRRV